MRGMSLGRFVFALLMLSFVSCSLEYDTSESPEDIGRAGAALEDLVLFPTTTFVDEYSPNQNFAIHDRWYLDYWALGLLRVSGSDATTMRQTIGNNLVRRAYIRLTVDSAAWDPYTLRIFRMKEGVEWEPASATWNCAEDLFPTNGTEECDPEWDFKATDPSARPHVVAPSDEVTLTTLPAQFETIDLDVTGDVMRVLAGQSMSGWAIRYDAPADPYSFLRVFGYPAASQWRPQLVIELADETDLPPECPNPSLPELDDSRIARTYDVTQHLTSGACAVQTIGPDTIDPRRASHLRGRVVDGAGAAIAGADVTILHHPELGWTRTRSDGWWDLVVNGGGPMTVEIRKAGYLPMQRTLDVPWNDYLVTDQLVLVPQQTTGCLSVSGANGGFYVRPAGSDARVPFGVWIPSGTQARLSPTSTLPSYHVCGAEYTVDRTGGRGEQAMPGELPATSGYTYANELEIRSSSAPATRVESPYFTQMGGSCSYSPTAPNHCSGACCTGGRDCNPAGQCVQPVFVYVKDPLGMPVGNRVPSGTYDRSQAAWGASDDGRVVRVVSYNGGCAFDLTNDSAYTAADDTGYGSLAYNQTPAEQTAFSSQCGAGLPFQEGDRIWRIPVNHFSAWDFNWGLLLPAGALLPFLQWANDGTCNGPCQGGGSVIGFEGQTLGESIPITGTPWALHYQSERQRGRQDRYRLRIPFGQTQIGSGSPVPPTEVRLEIQIAGRRFDPSPVSYTTGFYDFTWDGMDAWGRLLQGAQPITVRMGYVYPTQYGQPSSASGSSFQAPADTSLTVNAREIVFWATRRGLIGGWDQGAAPDGSQRGQGLGGWSVTPHHVYDARAGVLYRGDGTQLSTRGVEPRISSRYSNTILGPRTVTVAPDGALYFAVADGSSANNRVYRVTGSTSAEAFAGAGPQGSADGAALGPATFQHIKDIAFASDGTLYVLQSSISSSRLRRVRDGQVTTVISSGLIEPSAIAVGPGDSVYIAEPSADRITVWRESGTYVFASGSLVDNPRGIVVAPDGAVLAAVSGGGSSTYLIRRIAPSGSSNERFTAVAGGASACDPVAGNPLDGDGGPATGACIRDPSALSLDREGNLFITQNNGNVLRVRRVSTAGIIDTVAGAGGGQVCSPTPCSPVDRALGDGGPATSAYFRSLDDVAVGSDGHVYLADSTNYRVREISPALADSIVGETVIAETDGSLLYRFDDRGRHVRTESGLTGATLMTFSYVGTSGLLQRIDQPESGVADLDVLRNSSGVPTALSTAWGQTTLSMSAQGNLWRVTNPAGNVYTSTYWTAPGWEGLLQSFDNPTAAGASWLTYDQGRLIGDSSPTGLGAITQNLARSTCAGPDCWFVTHTYGGASWQPRVYAHERVVDGTRRSVTTPLGARTAWEEGDLEGSLDAPIGTGTYTEQLQVGLRSEAPDGTTTSVAFGADPRPGIDPFPRVVQMVRPVSGVTTTVTDLRTTPTPLATISDLTQMTDVLRINGARRTERVVTVDDASSTCRTEVVMRSPLSATVQGATTTTCYDATNRVTSFAMSGLEPITVSYEIAGGRPAVITQGGVSAPGSRRTELSYVDGFAQFWEPRQVLARENVAGSWTTRERTTFTRNADWYPTSILHERISPASTSTITLVPDQVGRTTQITTPLGRVHQQAFSPLDALSRYTPPNRTGTGPCANGTCPSVLDIPAFDPAHRPDRLEVRDGPTGTIGMTVDYEYEPTHGYLWHVTLPDARILEITRRATTTPDTVQANGRISTMTFDGTTLGPYVYDGPYLQDEQWSGTEVAGTVRHVTDAFGELDQLVINPSSSPRVIDYTRNEEGQITAVTVSGVAATYAPTTLRVGSGSTEHWERTTTLGNTSSRETLSRYGELDLFEVCNSLSCPGGTSRYRYQVTARDHLGREMARTEVTNGTTENLQYTYDGEGRLSLVRLGGSVVALYTYDTNGNRSGSTYLGTWSTTSRPPASATFDNQDRILTYSTTSPSNTCTYSYDALGQWQTRSCTATGTTSYVYDALGNLRTVAPPGGRTIHYSVDARGRRVRRYVTVGASIVEDQRWLYGDGLNPVAELNGTNQLLKVFVYASRPNVPDYMVDVAAGGTLYRLVSDPRGSVRMVINAGTGAIAQQINYDAFGYVLSDTQPGYQPFGFAGGLYDDETGLVRFGARDYDAITGRWTAKDPLIFGGGDTNLYGYVGNDPVNFIDPSGRFILRAMRALTEVVGLALGVIGSNDAAINEQGNIEFYNNFIVGWAQSENGAVTIGSTICYAGGPPTEEHRRHENAHTEQFRVLGGTYLPAHVVAQLISAGMYAVFGASSFPGGSDPVSSYNPLEWGPRSPERKPWPW